MIVKDRRTKILLALFLLKDISLDFINLGDQVQNIFDFSLNQKTRGTLSSLLRDQLVEKKPQEQQDSSPEYKLTEKGFLALCLKFPFFRFLTQEWDGKWRVISYEIPEKKRHLRDRLRREMAGWGLGPWHRSFWLTPHSIIGELRDLVSQKEEEKYIQAFEAGHIFGDKETLIEKVWNKLTLEKKYRELFKKWHEILSKDENKMNKFRKVIGEYITVLRDDPGLPSRLLGMNWIGYDAFNIFKEIRGILMS